MRKAEIESFAKLLGGQTAQNLIRVFFLRERLKDLGPSTREFRHVHVIGAGSMGGDIAAWCALQGLRVSLADRDGEALAGAIGRAAALYRERLREPAAVRAALDRLIPDFTGDGVARADLVIEAVPERIDVKRQVHAAVEPHLKEGAILATNTSSIRLEALSDGLKDPGRLVGLHFFNPVARMQLVEVVSHDQARAETLAGARAFCGQIDRLPVPVKSAPGFLVNRALTPYLLEAMAMLDEGVEAETIDRAAEAFGMPMGPIELADRVGLDICLDVAAMLGDTLERPLAQVPDWLREKVDNGDLGRKTGKGLYDYEGGKPKKDSAAPEPDAAMADRLMLPLLDACVACLREGVVEDPDLIDAAMVFGTGFAPFLGGPLFHARARGIDDVVAALERLKQTHGPRFTPDDGWGRLGETSKEGRKQ
jgi:3-hydroxyacyl-CoA dehydrogenase/enoyl-CoA hydratase/3-hydroxybutyryl-CoA epimerase